MTIFSDLPKTCSVWVAHVLDFVYILGYTWIHVVYRFGRFVDVESQIPCCVGPVVSQFLVGVLSVGIYKLILYNPEIVKQNMIRICFILISSIWDGVVHCDVFVAILVGWFFLVFFSIRNVRFHGAFHSFVKNQHLPKVDGIDAPPTNLLREKRLPCPWKNNHKNMHPTGILVYFSTGILVSFFF